VHSQTTSVCNHLLPVNLSVIFRFQRPFPPHFKVLGCYPRSFSEFSSPVFRLLPRAVRYQSGIPHPVFGTLAGTWPNSSKWVIPSPVLRTVWYVKFVRTSATLDRDIWGRRQPEWVVMIPGSRRLTSVGRPIVEPSYSCSWFRIVLVLPHPLATTVIEEVFQRIISPARDLVRVSGLPIGKTIRLCQLYVSVCSVKR